MNPTLAPETEASRPGPSSMGTMLSHLGLGREDCLEEAPTCGTPCGAALACPLRRSPHHRPVRISSLGSRSPGHSECTPLCWALRGAGREQRSVTTHHLLCVTDLRPHPRARSCSDTPKGCPRSKTTTPSLVPTACLYWPPHPLLGSRPYTPSSAHSPGPSHVHQPDSKGLLSQQAWAGLS